MKICVPVILLLLSSCVGDQPPGAIAAVASDAGTRGAVDAPDAFAQRSTDAGLSIVDAAPACDPALLSIWHGDNTPVDALGRNPLTWSSPIHVKYATGPSGKAFDFSTLAGPGERVFVANNAASGFDGASELTFSVWANPFVPGKVALGNLVTIDPAPTEAGANSAETKIAVGLGQATSADNTTSILQLSVNGKLVAPESTTRANTTDAWIHYVVTLKNTVTSTSLQFYVNGVLKDQGMVDGKLPPFSAPRITLGGSPGVLRIQPLLG